MPREPWRRYPRQHPDVWSRRPQPDFRFADYQILVPCEYCGELQEVWRNGTLPVVCDPCIADRQLEAHGRCLFAVLEGCEAPVSPTQLVCDRCYRSLTAHQAHTVLPKGAAAFVEHWRGRNLMMRYRSRIKRG